jgi:peptidoglycan-associated lipoprotein
LGSGTIFIAFFVAPGKKVNDFFIILWLKSSEFVSGGLFMFRNLLTLVGIGVLLMSCTTVDKDVSTVSSDVAAPGSAQDFNANVPNTVHFGFDSAVIQQGDKNALRQVAGWFKLYTSTKVSVEGHTDSRGTPEYNLALGSKRAEAVKAFLVSEGVERARISTISYGKESPIALGETSEDHAKNRRAHVLVAD